MALAATEEEECDGCDGANPRRRLDDSLLCLADGILLRYLIVLSIVIVCNAEGRPEEQGRPRCQQCVRCLLPRGVCLICNIFNITPEAGGRSKGSVVTAAAVSAATVATIAADTNEIGSQRWQWWG